MSKWEKNRHYYTLGGEEFVYLDSKKRGKQVYHLVKFVESDNYQYVHSSILNNPSRMRDSSKPHIMGVGYSSGTKDAPFSPHLYPRAYEVWCDMINRCYFGGSGMRSYKDVEVAEEWHNFNNFLSWFEKEVYDDSAISKFQLALDKDLFGGARKIYSPETCCFLPKSINSCLVGLNASDFTKDTARRMSYLELQVNSFGEILAPKVRMRLTNLIQDYAKQYYRLVGFTPKQIFADEHKVLKDLGKVRVNGFVEYDGEVYKFKTLKEIKEFVELIEQEEKADVAVKMCNNIMKEGKHRKLNYNS